MASKNQLITGLYGIQRAGETHERRRSRLKGLRVSPKTALSAAFLAAIRYVDSDPEVEFCLYHPDFYTIVCSVKFH